VSSAIDGVLSRINRATGERTELSLGTALNAMFCDGIYLYVAEEDANGGTGVLSVYKVELSSFTLSATISCATATTFADCCAIYVDSSNIYLGGRSSTGGSSGAIYKTDLAGAAVANLVITAHAGGTGADKGIKSLNFDGTNIYFTSMETRTLGTQEVTVTKVPYSLAGATNYTTAAGDTRRIGGVSTYLNGCLYVPITISTSVENTTIIATNFYQTALLKCDMSTGTFTEYPLATCGKTDGASNAHILHNCINDGTYIYIGLIGTSGATNVELIRFDPSDGSYIGTVYPMYGGITQSGNNGANYMITLDTDNTVICLPPGIASTVNNFKWFYPTFN
jgi:hypothetical protein